MFLFFFLNLCCSYILLCRCIIFLFFQDTVRMQTSVLRCLLLSLKVLHTWQKRKKMATKELISLNQYPGRLSIRGMATSPLCLLFLRATARRLLLSLPQRVVHLVLHPMHRPRDRVPSIFPIQSLGLTMSSNQNLIIGGVHNRRITYLHRHYQPHQRP